MGRPLIRNRPPFPSGALLCFVNTSIPILILPTKIAEAPTSKSPQSRPGRGCDLCKVTCLASQDQNFPSYFAYASLDLLSRQGQDSQRAGLEGGPGEASGRILFLDLGAGYMCVHLVRCII